MKMLTKIALAIVFMVGTAVATVSAQQVKIGYINTEELIPIMPEYTKAQTDFEAKTKEVEDQRTKMMEEYQAALKEYNEKAESYTSIVRQAKEQEIVTMQQRIQNFVELAQNELDKVQQELMTPIVTKINTTIEQVAKENGYTYIISSGALLYTAPTASDILPLVKSKMGLK